MGYLVKIDDMEVSVKLSSHVGIRHNWTDCSRQAGKYWVKGGKLMWIPPGSVGPDLTEDQGSPCKFLPYTLTEICHSPPCLPTSWHWHGRQWCYDLGVSGRCRYLTRGSCCRSHGGRSAGCWGITGSSNGVKLVTLSSSAQHFWSRRTRANWWSLTCIKSV